MKFKSYKDIIEYLKPFAISVMKSFKIPCSVTIGILMNECIHNDYAIDDTYQQKYLDLLKEKRVQISDTLVSRRNALALLCDSDYNQVSSIIDDFSLIDIDVEIQDKYLLNDKHVIDSKIRRPFLDNYVVKKDNYVLLRTDNYQEAYHMAIREQCAIYNSYGNKIYDNSPIKQSNIETKIFKINKLEKGQQVTIKNANLYKKYSSKIPSRCISGTFQITDGRNMNERYLLSTIGEDSYEVGYVKVKDLKSPSV